MSTREGNLEAPTRHPLDWKSADFYDEASAFKEMERVFDICHGCRRCVSLCQSFPNLFDLVDATADGEVHGVEKQAYWKVVDQCYLCDLCYMTKCPYTPPHAWNLDFPHLMLRAKAIKFRKGEVKGGEKFLASTDVHGQFAGIPIVVQAVNAVNRTKFARKQMDSMLGVHPDAWMPDLAAKRFRWSAAKSPASVATRGERTPGKVAIFSTCYVNYNEPGIGHDLLKTDFKAALGKVSYHIPCHGRVQNIGRKTEEMFKLIGQSVEVKLNTVERCSGHAGTYGVKTPYHPMAMKIGRPVFKAMAKDEPDVIASDCALAGHHIAHARADGSAPAHPITLVRLAYGI